MAATGAAGLLLAGAGGASDGSRGAVARVLEQDAVDTLFVLPAPVRPPSSPTPTTAPATTPTT